MPVIALLPTYSHLSYASIVLPSLLRSGQGIALGGSWDGLPSLPALNAPQHRRGWYTMLGQLGPPVGFIAAGLFSYRLFNLSIQSRLSSFGRCTPLGVASLISVFNGFVPMLMRRQAILSI